MELGVDVSAAFATALVPLQILFVDLLLSADNALLIALACRGLAETEMRQASLIGTLGAVVLRIGMGAVALMLLRVPFLRVAAGLVLLYIAIKLTLDQDDGDIEDLLNADPLSEEDRRRRTRSNLISAVWAIIVADATMSLDNVVAVAAIAKDSMVLLGLGLLMSIPMLVWGSTIIRAFLNQNRFLVLWAGAFLGWIAGGIVLTDPMIAPSIDIDAPALTIAIPLATATFVIWQSRILDRHRLASGGANVD